MFEIKGLSDEFSGSGHFSAENTVGKTIMTGKVEVNAAGRRIIRCGVNTDY